MSLSRRWVAVLAATAAAGGVVAGTASLAEATRDAPDPGAGRVVLVSGRDDHGELADAQVVLTAAPASERRTGTVADGTLVRVLAARGEWLEVRALEGRPVRGWVNDYYLRGALHLVGPAPACAVRLGDAQLPAGQPATVLAVRSRTVRVRTLDGASTGWVPRTSVRELPPSAAEGCLVRQT